MVAHMRVMRDIATIASVIATIAAFWAELVR